MRCHLFPACAALMLTVAYALVQHGCIPRAALTLCPSRLCLGGHVFPACAALTEDRAVSPVTGTCIPACAALTYRPLTAKLRAACIPRVRGTDQWLVGSGI